ncbi:DNA-binding protein [Methylobacter sp. YRD-M1]|uniref:DNA-binding protein n=1 Tax=Methylobacter sp. YRD-M1 TaxID=2911520 RepID=UPI00227A6446|nr:DNA-binding protein [Methylobacter sp. YRD-M1]WAK04610.1 DNA-binding protein [Methylobacter sp. YRD-M1]
MAAPRLTEEEVHEVCAEIAAQGERPTALMLLDRLGRGSLTTITKYLNSWNVSDEAKALGAESLPTIVELPSELAKDGEGLIKKIWAIAKGIADDELDIQREALKQAEIANQAKVEEAFKFSEAQAMKIERLEDVISDLKSQLAEEQSDHAEIVAKLNEAEKSNVGLTKDNEQLQHEISDLKNRVAMLEELNKTAARENQEQQQKHNLALKQKDTETRSLDMQVHKLQTSLDSTAKANDQLKEELKSQTKQKDAEIRSLDMQVHKLQASLDSTVKANEQLKADIKSKTSELSERVIELEKLGVRYGAVADELKAAKEELKATGKVASDAEKRVAKLEGQLEVYKSLDKQETGKGSSS